MFSAVDEVASSSGSSEVRIVGAWVSEGPAVPSGWVGGWSWTVAFGSETVWAPPAGTGAVLSATVGAPAPVGVLSLIVGAGAGAPPPAGRSAMVGAGAPGAPAGRREMVGAGALGAPAGRRAMVGAGAGAFGAPTVGAGAVAVGGAEIPVGIGGRGAPGAAGGASEALSVTRTVSFFRGIDEVCLEGGIDDVGRGAGTGDDEFGVGVS